MRILFEHTYGLLAINNNSFNNSKTKTIPKNIRDGIVTFYKAHNIVLNTLGYMKGFSKISGSVRIISGVILGATTLIMGDPKASDGTIIGHFYRESLYTSFNQIFRGAVEAFLPKGRLLNASLDFIATLINVNNEFQEFKRNKRDSNDHHHADPQYPLYLFPLNFF